MANSVDIDKLIVEYIFKEFKIDLANKPREEQVLSMVKTGSELNEDSKNFDLDMHQLTVDKIKSIICL